MEYKIELIKLGKTQADVVRTMLERGIKVDPSELSLALGGRQRPKHQMLREKTEEIIEEWKKG